MTKRAPRSNPVSTHRQSAARKPRVAPPNSTNHSIMVSFRQSEDGQTIYGRIGSIEVALPLLALEPFEIRQDGEDRLVCTIPLQSARALASTKARS